MVFVLVMVFFSLSDGYITNMTMMFGPKSVRKDLQEITASLMVATVAFSLCLGSIFSNLVVKAL